MAKRVPASMCTRESLSDLIEGRLSSAAGRAEPVKLAARLIVEEALETESRDVLDRDYFGLACQTRGSSWKIGPPKGDVCTMLRQIGQQQAAGAEKGRHRSRTCGAALLLGAVLDALTRTRDA